MRMPSFYPDIQCFRFGEQVFDADGISNDEDHVEQLFLLFPKTANMLAESALRSGAPEEEG
ncbi:MAG TPA: hypothetical protein VE077_11160 [Candidatus Methylomirabilis sp.]|nr:hypothetical protein [Candidatus Methylomirabilis sp.]